MSKRTTRPARLPVNIIDRCGQSAAIETTRVPVTGEWVSVDGVSIKLQQVIETWSENNRYHSRVVFA